MELTYIDGDNIKRTLKDCNLIIDKNGRHWFWSEQLQHNIACRTKTKEDTLIAAIDSLLFTIQLKDERIADLQKIANLASAFADQIKPDSEDDQAFLQSYR